MDRQTILLISDMRQVCLAEILTKKGHNVRCLDIRNRETALQQLEKLDRTVDEIRRRFGYFSIQRAAMYQDKVLSHLDAGTHTVHPHSYFHG